MSNVSIRSETPADQETIRDLIVEVFRETYGSGDAEAGIVDEMRRQVDIGTYISLVAVLNDTIVGHIFFSPVKLTDFPDIPVCVLGPVGVGRKWQKRGIGSLLIREGLEQCQGHGYRAVFTTGSLQYYLRFGFVPIGTTNLETIFKTEHDMVMELESGLLRRVSGLVEYPEPWRVFL
ncbi:MAG: N-acetyltransferase [Planctomycetota bacterium]|nr:MAG: N-acetyltransferase [Planctomycetota bacterium]